MKYAVTPEEEAIIDRCCAWLDEDAIDQCVGLATEAADQITQPEVAAEKLVEMLIEIIVRNRRTARQAR